MTGDIRGSIRTTSSAPPLLPHLALGLDIRRLAEEGRDTAGERDRASDIETPIETPMCGPLAICWS
jgi:hypothetical protein